MKLLDFQTANWKSQKAYDITSGWLTRFGDKIKGVWAANDDMGMGALEALRAEGLAGKSADRRRGRDQGGGRWRAQGGEFVCTMTSDPYWQGGMGLSIRLTAKHGKFDPSKEPNLHREFYAQDTEITKANVAEYIKTQVQSHPQIDWSGSLGPSGRADRL